MDDNSVEEMAEINEVEYAEILAKLEDGYLANKLVQSEEWKLVLKAAKQVRDIAQEKYNHMDHTTPDAKFKAMECQLTIQFYDDFLTNLIARYKALASEAYDYAKSMGWIKRMSLWIQSQF